jgi:charged multivesicular body protein 5
METRLTGCSQTAVQQKALRVLKQRKMCAAISSRWPHLTARAHRYEAQRDQLQQQSYNMEQASMTTENLRNTMATVDAMKTANKEIKRQYGKINIDKIEVR